MPHARIAGTGMYVPDRVVTNEELGQWMDTSPEWILQRTGIEQRRWVTQPTGVSDLAIAAAQMAMAEAGWNKSDVDIVLFATLSADMMFPGSGCVFQEKFGLGSTPALDIRNQCSGFLYGLAVAKGFCESGLYRRVLLIGAENHSSGLDVTTDGRNVSVIFGDGAGAACIEAVDRPGDGAIGPVILHADGAGRHNLAVEVPAAVRQPVISHDQFLQKQHMPHMDGPTVFRHAVTRLEEVALEILGRAGLTADDIALVIPHQANMRINLMVAGRLDIPESKVYHNIQRYGNTTAASIPIALHEARREGRIRTGDRVMLLAFGAGFTWGAAIVQA